MMTTSFDWHIMLTQGNTYLHKDALLRLTSRFALKITIPHLRSWSQLEKKKWGLFDKDYFGLAVDLWLSAEQLGHHFRLSDMGE